MFPLGTQAIRSNLVKIYQQIIQKDAPNFLSVITENAELYAILLRNDENNTSLMLRQSLEDLSLVQGSPSYQLLLFLLKNKQTLSLQDEELNQIVIILVKFFASRNLTDTPPTRDLDRIFINIIESIKKNDVHHIDLIKIIRDSLLQHISSESLLRDVLEGPIYTGNSAMTRFILYYLSKPLMTKEKTIDLWQKISYYQYNWTIEHVLPQGDNIPESWVEMIADGDKEKARQIQSQYVHNLGNLTFSGYNSNLGSKSFIDKKNHKDKNGNFTGYRNGLGLNEYIVMQDTWGVKQITERTTMMVNELIKLLAL